MTKKMVSRKRVAILTFSEVTRDPRIRRVAEALTSRGHDVRVFTLQLESNRASEWYKGFQIIRSPAPISYELEVDAFCDALGSLSQVAYTLWPDLLSRPSKLSSATSSTSPSISPNPSWSARIKNTLRAILPRKVQNGMGRLLGIIRGFCVWIQKKTTAIWGKLFPDQTAQSTLTPDRQTYTLPSRSEVDQKALRDLTETSQRMQINLEMFRVVNSWATHVYANDLETLFAGVMLKQKYNVCLLYDAHEIWPQQWVDGYRSSSFLGYYSTMEKILLHSTDVRITIGDGLARYFEYAYASPPFAVIPNTPSVKHLCPESVLQRRSAKRGMIYHGIFTPFRGYEEIIEIAPMLDNCRIAFRGVGDHGKVLRHLAKEKGQNHRIEFLPPVKVDGLVVAASKFDIGLIPAVNVCLNTNYGFPNKLFEYMMAGLAIATTNLVDLKKIVSDLEMGVVFDVANKEQVAEKLNFLLRNPDMLDSMRYNAWRAARDTYNWETSYGNLVRVLGTCDL